jgi:hypothetical protein
MLLSPTTGTSIEKTVTVGLLAGDPLGAGDTDVAAERIPFY